MDMEEGELSGSSGDEAGNNPSQVPSIPEDILDEGNYVIIDRPKRSVPPSSSSSSMAAVTQPVTMMTSDAPRVPDVPGGDEDDDDYYASFGKRAYYNRSGVSDLLGDSDKSSSESDDSDDDGPFGKKRVRMGMPPGNPFPGGSTGLFGGSSGANYQTEAASEKMSTNSDFFAEAAKFQKTRKPNTIWSNVLQEEEISKGLGHQVRVGGGLAEIEVTRGPETYFYERAVRPPRQRRASDSSEISSGGLSDNALDYLRNGEVDWEATGEEGEEVTKREPVKRSDKDKDRKALKRRKSSQKHKEKVIKNLTKMKALDLAKYMAKKLQESKVKLVKRAIDTLGKDKTVKVFLKTLKIEKRGGIMVKSHSRRRTPGGVFLYLIRGDPRFPKHLVDHIFSEENRMHEQARKQKEATYRLKKKAELESALENDKKIAGESTSEQSSDQSNPVPEDGGDDEVDNEENSMQADDLEEDEEICVNQMS